MLGLFVSDDPAAEEDRWLNNIIEAAMKEGFKAYGLNDGLIEIDLGGGAAAETQQEEEEEEEVPPTPTKRASKKAAASPNGAKPTSTTYTRDDLEDMELDQLKEIAASKGIELPPRTRMATYINEILGVPKEDSGDAVRGDHQPASDQDDSSRERRRGEPRHRRTG